MKLLIIALGLLIGSVSSASEYTDSLDALTESNKRLERQLQVQRLDGMLCAKLKAEALHWTACPNSKKAKYKIDRDDLKAICDKNLTEVLNEQVAVCY